MNRVAKPDAIALLAALQPAVTTVPPPSPSPLPAAAVRRSRQRKPKPGARAGTRLIGAHFPEATLKALKHLMAEEDATLQALLEEAIADFLVKKGRVKLTL